MSAIMLTTGLCFEVGETRTQAKQLLGGANQAVDLTVNGVVTTFRATAIIAVADSLDGLAPSYVAPKMPESTIPPPTDTTVIPPPV